MKPRPARISGTDSSMPMVSAAPQEAELRRRARGRIRRTMRAMRVADREGADDQARPLQRAGADQQRQHGEQQPGLPAPPRRAGSDGAAAARRRETPSPRARRPARPHNSPLMKLAMRPRNSPIGADRAGDVAERQDRNAALAREQQHGDHAAGKAAVERHAAVPQLHDLERMRGEVRQIVEQHVADAAAEDDAERHPEDEIVEVGDASSAPARPTAARCG